MPADTLGILVSRISQSALLEPAQRKELTEKLAGEFPELNALCRELLRRGWLTMFQLQHCLQARHGELILGQYVLLEKLGEGGNGQVFKARHQRMKRIVALKVVRPELVVDEDVVNRFYREIEVISHISHPHIVHAFDAGPVGKSLVLAMEYVDGVDLHRLVKEGGPRSVRDACEYIRQAALGLAHAHEKGLVHRDIKPANFLLSKPSLQGGSMVKLLDLGLARLQQPAASSRTRNLTVLGGNNYSMGTPDFQSPEQALDFHGADIRADIYSLGCTFYYLLIGKPPFEGSLPEKLIKHQQTEPKSVSDLRADVPPELTAVLARMMTKRPEDRYQTPHEVAEALEQLLENLPSDGPPAKVFDSVGAGSTMEFKSDETPMHVLVPDTLMQSQDKQRLTAKMQVTDIEKRPRRNRAPIGLVLAALLGLGILFTVIYVFSRPTSEPIASAPVVVPPTTTTEPKRVPGLRYAYYEGNWNNKLPNFDKLTPVKTGSVTHLDLKDRKRNDNFAFSFVGLLKVDKPGKYTFFLITDDGGRFFLDDKLLIDDDGPHANQEKQASVELKPGEHPFKVHFYQVGGGFALELHWQGPDIPNKVRIPENVLFQGAR